MKAGGAEGAEREREREEDGGRKWEVRESIKVRPYFYTASSVTISA